MSEKTTYTAVLMGANPLSEGTEREIEFVNGEYQAEIVIEFDEPSGMVTRTFVLEAATAEPIPYRYVGEVDSGGEPTEPN